MYAIRSYYDFVHNRVQSIDAMAGYVKRLLPSARVAVAHGQMPGGELDEIMRRFVHGGVDILVCSSIIERNNFV